MGTDNLRHYLYKYYALYDLSSCFIQISLTLNGVCTVFKLGTSYKPLRNISLLEWYPQRPIGAWDTIWLPMIKIDNHWTGENNSIISFRIFCFIHWQQSKTFRNSQNIFHCWEKVNIDLQLIHLSLEQLGSSKLVADAASR